MPGRMTIRPIPVLTSWTRHRGGAPGYCPSRFTLATPGHAVQACEKKPMEVCRRFNEGWCRLPSCRTFTPAECGRERPSIHSSRAWQLFRSSHHLTEQPPPPPPPPPPPSWACPRSHPPGLIMGNGLGERVHTYVSGVAVPVITIKSIKCSYYSLHISSWAGRISIFTQQTRPA